MSRYHFRETRQFLYISRGSLAETKTWIKKALNRQLIHQEEYDILVEQFESLGVKINTFIRTINKNMLEEKKSLDRKM